MASDLQDVLEGSLPSSRQVPTGHWGIMDVLGRFMQVHMASASVTVTVTSGANDDSTVTDLPATAKVLYFLNAEGEPVDPAQVTVSAADTLAFTLPLIPAGEYRLYYAIQ